MVPESKALAATRSVCRCALELLCTPIQGRRAFERDCRGPPCRTLCTRVRGRGSHQRETGLEAHPAPTAGCFGSNRGPRSGAPLLVAGGTHGMDVVADIDSLGSVLGQFTNPQQRNPIAVPLAWLDAKSVPMANEPTSSQTGSSQAQVPRFARRGALVATGGQVPRGSHAGQRASSVLYQRGDRAHVCGVHNGALG